MTQEWGPIDKNGVTGKKKRQMRLEKGWETDLEGKASMAEDREVALTEFPKSILLF